MSWSQIPARVLLLLAVAHGAAEPPPNTQLAAIAHRIQKVLEYHWGGHHPAMLDVAVAQAWYVVHSVFFCTVRIFESPSLD